MVEEMDSFVQKLKSLLFQVKTILDDILEKLPEEYNMSDITSKTAERSPYILVCFQECERMNMLLNEIRRSLKELDLGLKVCYYFCVSSWIVLW